MIGYTSLGTNDLNRSASFYDQIFESLGGKRTYSFEDFIVWGKDHTQPMFSVHKPYDGKYATVGNGVMIALVCSSKKQVDDTYNLALKLGALDEGGPGERMDSFYAAYFRDLDGNKLNVHYFGN